MTTIALIIVEVVILSVAQFVRTVFFSQLEISHVLNGPTAKNQHRSRGPKGHCAVDFKHF